MTKLPAHLITIFTLHIRHSIKKITPISSSGFTKIARIETTTECDFLIKWQDNPVADNIFDCEGHALHLLEQVNALKVPEYHYHDHQCLIMSWLQPIDLPKTAVADELGQGLALQHRTTADRYGLSYDNYCGPTPQRNTQHDSWPQFFAQCRLEPQMILAQQNNLLPKPYQKRLETLITRLPNLLPATPPASLLHGDLWQGNWLVVEGSQPAVIDPAIYYGHREADVAFTELFGRFPSEFYEAYQAAWPFEPGYNERKHIYNLYHLLNHLNLFGKTYLTAIDTTLAHFD